MNRGTALLAILLWAAGSVLAVSPGPATHQAAVVKGELVNDMPVPAHTGARNDTIWFGGDDGSGYAIQGQEIWWDFEDGTFQGCESEDETTNPDDYFKHAHADTFAAHGDPTVPMMERPMGTPTVGQLICVIHQDEADERDFVAGMGYQNDECQSAFSPEYAFQAGIYTSIKYDIFHHSEPEFDYTYVYVRGYDSLGDQIVEQELVRYDGASQGNEVDPWTTPEYDQILDVGSGVLTPDVATFQFEFRFKSDSGWADEDGFWDTPSGPCGFDNVEISINAVPIEAFDFDSGPQGWTFERCPGVGAYMHLVDEVDFQEWLEYLNIHCGCPLAGKAVNFCGTVDPEGWPALVPGQKEMFLTGIVDRTAYSPTPWSATIAQWDQYVNFPLNTGAHYRTGYKMYPYTTEVNPFPHWSSRRGQNVWYYSSNPYCSTTNHNLSTLDGNLGEPLPTEYDLVRFTYEIYCSCDAFGTPSTACMAEGHTIGAPTLDNLRIGLTGSPLVPVITWMDGGLVADGFGQNFTSYLEPSDRCNFNASYNLSMNNPDKNDWHADTTAVTGRIVTTEEGRWLAEFCFKIARKGARQDMIPEYINWKSRMAVHGDPEVEFIAVLMDSCMSGTNAWKHKFCTYIHESDPAYNIGYAQQTEEQEMLPDGMLVPGTRVEYYWRSYWFNGGAPPAEYYYLASEEYPREVEFLPNMQLSNRGDFMIEWPCVLFIDAYNRGVEQYILPVLNQLQIEWDKFDYQDASSNYCCAMRRTYGLGAYNPGGYGNNGCTDHQLLGYRLIIVNTGVFSAGCMHDEDFDMFEDWLATTDCGLSYVKRGIIFNGDGIAEIMEDYTPDFINNRLGVTVIHSSYREFNQDPANCVCLVPSLEAPYWIPEWVGLWGSGCPLMADFAVLGKTQGVPGIHLGTLDYYSCEQTGIDERVSYAEVIRDVEDPGGEGLWMSVVDGFSYHHLTSLDGVICQYDSTSIGEGIAIVLGSVLNHMEDPSAPFVKWSYPCTDAGTDDDEKERLSGAVSHLYAGRPNPCTHGVAIRFRLAQSEKMDLSIYDVGGRLIRRLVDKTLEAGEHTHSWDATNEKGDQVEAGIFWIQMTTASGYQSSKRLLVIQ